MDIKYFPITFITEKSDIENQISNSVIFAELFKTNQTTNLKYYLESTQYGYTASALSGGSHKLVRITDIKANGVDWDSVPFCNCENDKKFLLKKDDILVTRTGGTVGKSFIVKDCPEKSVYASYLIRLRLNEKANIDFINMFLNSYLFWNQIFDLKSGAAIPNVNAEKLKEIKIPLCTLEQQVEILSNQLFFEKKQRVNLLYNLNYDNAIELKNQFKIINNLRQAFLREAMQGKLVSNETSDGKTGADLLKEIRIEKEKLIKEKNIKKGKSLSAISKDEIPFEIPDNWVWSRLDEITINCDQARKPISRSIRNSLEKKYDYYGASGIIDKINDFTHDGKFLLIGEDGNNLLSKSTPLAFIAEGKFWVNNHAHVLKYSNDQVLNYMKYWLNTFDIKPYLTGGFQPKFSQGKMNLVAVPLPPKEVQKSIIIKLNELMNYCDDLEKSVKESQNYNDQLLQQVLREALDGKEYSNNEMLPLVAEESAIYKTFNDPNKNCDIGDMAILSGYIIKKLSTENSKDFGRVKLQKMLHLTEYHCQLSSELNYQKNVAGPYSTELEHLVEPKLKSYRFFDIKKEKLGNNSKVTYKPLSASAQLSSMFNREFQDQANGINNLLEKFQDKTWDFCEMISTMYAVWNNRLVLKEEFTNEILKQDFLAWDEKKKRFIDQLDYAIEWIKKEKIEPVGFGDYIDRK